MRPAADVVLPGLLPPGLLRHGLLPHPRGRAARALAAGLLLPALVACSGDDATTSSGASPSSAVPSESSEPAPTPTELDANACQQLNRTPPLLATPAPLQTQPSAVVVPEAAATELGTVDELVGDGPTVQAGDCLVVNYVGVGQASGEVFDSSFARGQGFVVPIGLGAVIEGWDEGLPGATVGSRRRLTIPGELAYGAQPPGPPIQPDETLVFVVDLLAVVSADGEVVTGEPVGEPTPPEPGPDQTVVDVPPLPAG